MTSARARVPVAAVSDEAKIVRLAEPRMRAARAGASVPWFDPAGAGVEARTR